MDAFMNDVAYEDPELPFDKFTGVSGKAETFYNKIPRGILQLDNISIDAGSMTNKFVRAMYQRVQEDGTLKTFNSEVFMIPLKLPFTCSIYVDSNLDIFKAIQRIIEIFYKWNVFQVDIDGTRIPAVAGMPEDWQKERPLEYSFSDKKQWKVDFPIEIQTFMPIFKNADNGFDGAEDTEMFAGTVMQGMQTSSFITGASGGIQTTSVDPFNELNETVGSKDGRIGAAGRNQSSRTWPNKPSGYSNPLPPKGGSTAS